MDREMRTRRKVRKLADIDRELSGKLAKCWYMATILVFFLLMLGIAAIISHDVVIVFLLLVNLFFWVMSIKGIVQIKSIRKDLRSNPEKFRYNRGEYTIPDVNIVLGGIVKI